MKAIELTILNNRFVPKNRRLTELEKHLRLRHLELIIPHKRKH